MDTITDALGRRDWKAALDALQSVAEVLEYPVEVSGEIADAFRKLPNDTDTTEEFVSAAVKLQLRVNQTYGSTDTEVWVTNYLPALDIAQEGQAYDLTPYYAELLSQVTTLSYCESSGWGEAIVERASKHLGDAHEVTIAIREWHEANEYY